MAEPGPHSEQQREERVRKALANPAYFGEVYFRPYDPNWTERIPGFAIDILRFCVTARRGVVVLPPEFMKTTCLQIYALWRTYRSRALGQLLRGMIACEEEQMAKGNLGVIAWHIENNERLLHDFRTPGGTPLVRPDPEQDVWRDTEIIIERPGMVSRDPTWQAKGLDSKGVQGRRLDCLLADDLITPKNAESPALRKRALDLWDLQFETRLVGPGTEAAMPPRGQALAMGNYNDSKDLLSTLSDRVGYQTFKRPSLHLPGQPDKAPGDSNMHEAVPTWPAVWPLDRLMDEKASKPLRFRRIHLLDSRAEGGDKLQVDWLTLVKPEDTPLRTCRFYMGYDDAPGGETNDLDYAVITVLGVHESGADIVESFALRAPLPRRIEAVEMLYQRWQRIGSGVFAIGGSKVAMDRYLLEAIAMQCPHLRSKLVGISVPGGKERLEGLGPHARSGWLRCWETTFHAQTSDPEDRKQELTLYEEWRGYPHAKHDDRLDSLDVVIRTANEFAGINEDYEHDLVPVAD